MYETSYRDQFTANVILKTINWFRRVLSSTVLFVRFPEFFFFTSFYFCRYRAVFLYFDCSCSFNTHQTWFVYWNWYMWKMVPYFTTSTDLDIGSFYILFSSIGSLSRVTHFINPATVAIFFFRYLFRTTEDNNKKNNSWQKKKKKERSENNIKVSTIGCCYVRLNRIDDVL